MGLDHIWWGKAIAASAQRPSHCPGFKIKELETAKTGEIRAGVHYNGSDKRPITVLCDHSGDCQPEAEYEYFFLWLLAKEHINLAVYKQLRPAPPLHGHFDELDDGGRAMRDSNNNRGIPNYCHSSLMRNGCIGFKLTDGPLAGRLSQNEEYNEFIPRSGWHYSPLSLSPYTEACDHQQCDPWTEAKWMVIKAIASGILPEEYDGKWQKD